MKHSQNYNVILLLIIAVCAIASCSKPQLLDHYAKLVNKPPDSIYRIHEKLVFDLSWQTDEVHRIIHSSFTLPDGHSGDDIIDMYGGLPQSGIHVPKYDGDTSLNLFYKVDGAIVTISKKYSGERPRSEDYDTFEAFFVATLMWESQLHPFSQATVVFW